MNHYPVLFWGNLLLNFVTPFFILMRNDTKRKFGTLFFVAAIVLFGHWWDYFYMIKPGARISAHEAMEHQMGKGEHSSKHEAAPMPAHTEEAKPAVTEAEKPAETAGHAAEHGTAAAHEAKTEGHETAAHEPATTPAAEATTAEAPHEAAHTEEHAAGGEHGEHAEVDESKAFKLGYTIPGLEEIGIMLGFLSLFLFFFFSQLERAGLVPKNDPFLEESLHHETGALIESEHEGGDGHDHH
jgi:hypothetical protein